MLHRNNLPVIYILDMQESLTSQQLGRIKKQLPYNRIISSEKFLRQKDRDTCLASFFLLVYGLKKLGISELPAIKTGEFGKPYFTNYNICFNISHCDKAVCCGISEHNIGVDVQDTVTDFDDIISTIMSQRETELISNSHLPSSAFTRLWSLKESFVKFNGTGLTDDVRTIEFLNSENDFQSKGCFFKVTSTPDYQLAACTVDAGTIFIKKSLTEYLEEIEKGYNEP